MIPCNIQFILISLLSVCLCAQAPKPKMTLQEAAAVLAKRRREQGNNFLLDVVMFLLRCLVCFLFRVSFGARCV